MTTQYSAVVTVKNKNGEVASTVGPANFRTREALDAWVTRQLNHYTAQGFSIDFRTFVTEAN